jgi:hypothetical protein
MASQGLVPRPWRVAAPDGPGGADQSPVELVWRCGICGYQRQARLRPADCRCGAPADSFEGRTAPEWRELLG